jgi:hypothetical protein
MSTTVTGSRNFDGVSSPPSISSGSGSFLFTGTGPAIPWNNRNVTGGMYVEMEDLPENTDLNIVLNAKLGITSVV